MLRLIKQIESISACRDRDLLGANVVTAIHDLLRPCRVTLMRVAATLDGPAVALVVEVNESGLCRFEDGRTSPPVPLAAQPLLVQAQQRKGPAAASGADGHTWVYPLAAAQSPGPAGFLQIDRACPPSAVEGEAIARFLHFYCNYLSLLDYSELDTLTGLLNRKTFDEAFDRILARSSSDAERRERAGDERRADGDPEIGHWLAVVDIDHFKRINDNFGHLFGDEVLLRVANLMRGAFRSEDRLFRFGGEEFVIMLRVGGRQRADQALQRLRRLVETHEFPQVGQVTCSIGFTAVDPRLAPTDILGQADEALYYAKAHGRNQVHCHEALIETGRLVRHPIAAQQPEIDIDALFG